MLLNGTINTLNFDNHKKVFFLNPFGQLSSEKIVGNDEVQEKMGLYTLVQLENNESNDNSD